MRGRPGRCGGLGDGAPSGRVGGQLTLLVRYPSTGSASTLACAAAEPSTPTMPVSPSRRAGCVDHLLMVPVSATALLVSKNQLAPERRRYRNVTTWAMPSK